MNPPLKYCIHRSTRINSQIAGAKMNLPQDTCSLHRAAVYQTQRECLYARPTLDEHGVRPVFAVPRGLLALLSWFSFCLISGFASAAVLAPAETTPYTYYYTTSATTAVCVNSGEEAAMGAVALHDDVCPDAFVGFTSAWGEDTSNPGFNTSSPEYCKSASITGPSVQNATGRKAQFHDFHLFGGSCFDGGLYTTGLLGNNSNFIRNHYWYCNPGWTLDHAGFGQVPHCIRQPNTPQPGRGLGGQPCSMMSGNPVNTSNGNKYQREQDYRGQGAFPLVFERHYNSQATLPGVLGKRWSHTYSRRLLSAHTPEGSTTEAVRLTRDDGQILYFDNSSGGWKSDVDVAGVLSEIKDAGGVRTGWQYKDEDDAVESYNLAGQLISVRSRAGVTLQLTYDTAGKLNQSTGSVRAFTRFVYDAQGRIDEVHDPATQIIAFDYDAGGNLVTVTYPGGATRQYLYDEGLYVATGAQPSLLTGITDEAGHRFATFTYDASSRATSTTHTAGAGQVDPPTTRTVRPQFKTQLEVREHVGSR